MMPKNPYGQRDFATLYKDIDKLRALIRSEGSENIQMAWDEVEPHIDAAYARPPTEAERAEQCPH